MSNPTLPTSLRPPMPLALYKLLPAFAVLGWVLCTAFAFQWHLSVYLVTALFLYLVLGVFTMLPTRHSGLAAMGLLFLVPLVGLAAWAHGERNLGMMLSAGPGLSSLFALASWRFDLWVERVQKAHGPDAFGSEFPFDVLPWSSSALAASLATLPRVSLRAVATSPAVSAEDTETAETLRISLVTNRALFVCAGCSRTMKMEEHDHDENGRCLLRMRCEHCMSRAQARVGGMLS